MAEEQQDRAGDRDRQGPQGSGLTPPDPGRGQQQRQTRSDREIEEALQISRIVHDQHTAERPPGETPERRAAVGDGAKHRHQQHDPQHDASRDMHGQEPHQRGPDDVNREVGNDAPIQPVKPCQNGVGPMIRQHHQAREMVGVIQHRRHIRQQQREQKHRAQYAEGGPPITARDRRDLRHAASTDDRGLGCHGFEWQRRSQDVSIVG